MFISESANKDIGNIGLLPTKLSIDWRGIEDHHPG